MIVWSDVFWKDVGELKEIFRVSLFEPREKEAGVDSNSTESIWNDSTGFDKGRINCSNGKFGNLISVFERVRKFAITGKAVADSISLRSNIIFTL